MTQEISVYNAQGKVVEKVNLDKNVFDGKINEPLLHQVVVMYQANKRLGTACAKTRSEVSGGGKKPWKQKGTGRARVGSSRNPLWRHGGVAFGPRPRYIYDVVPKSFSKAALKSSINAKLKDNEMVVLDELKIEKPKTKEMAGILKKLKISDRVLMVTDKWQENLVRSARNIPNLTLLPLKDVNALDVLNHAKLLMTKDTLKNLSKRF